jgi:hypothetical protein
MKKRPAPKKMANEPPRRKAGSGVSNPAANEGTGREAAVFPAGIQFNHVLEE